MDNVYKIDMVLVIVSLVLLMGIVGYARPLVIAPLDDYETTETDILFSIEKADVLLIDDNLDFTTPDEYSLKDGLEINLKPGKYYWKAVGVMDSEVRTLTINSEINLVLTADGEGYSVINAGNVGLNVDVYNGTELINSMKVGVGGEVDIEGDKFVGGQDE